MRAVDVGVGHDDDAVVAQRRRRRSPCGCRSRARGSRSAISVLARILSAVALATLRILPRIGRIAWVLRSRACLALPPALIALDDEQLGLAVAFARAVGELAGQAQLARVGRGLALDLALGLARAAARPSAPSRCRAARLPRSMLSARKWSKWSRTAFSTSRAASGRVSRSLVWLWNCGSRMNTESIISLPVTMSSGGDVLGLLLADQLAERADALGQRGAQALLVGAAVGGRDGVAVPAVGAVGPQRPGDRPFDAALLARREVLPAGEELAGDAFARRRPARRGGRRGRRGTGTPLRRALRRSTSDGAHFQRISTPANR